MNERDWGSCEVSFLDGWLLKWWQFRIDSFIWTWHGSAGRRRWSLHLELVI